jgi:hypothetical protein
MSYESKKMKASHRRSPKHREEMHDIGDAAVGLGGVALVAGGAPIVGGVLIGGTAVDMVHRHKSGKRKEAQPWK